MRSVPSGFTSIAGGKARTIGAYAVVEDHRLRFYNLSKIGNDSALYDGAMKSYDADASGSTIYRVANVNNTLYYMYLSNPGGSWPNWTNSGRALKADSRPGIYQNCVWYQKSNGDVVKSYFSGSSLGGENSVYTGLSGICALAPVSPDEAVVREAYSGKKYAKVSWMKDQTGIGLNYAWSGRLYKLSLLESTIEDQLFDAEKDPETGWTHVFWSDEAIGRIKTFRFSGISVISSGVEGVIPMDVVDDLNNFKMGGVTRGPVSSTSSLYSPSKAGNIWIGGALVRSDGGHMQMYGQGPPWTNGRDVYAGSDGTEERTYSGKTVPVAGGKIHFVGSNVYYIGPGVAYKASGTDWTGDSSPSTTINEIADWNYTQQANSSARITINIPYTVSSSVLREGSDLKLYAKYSTSGGSEYDVLIGTFNIDAIIKGEEQSSQYKTIIARSAAGKALEMWAPDTSYDYWGADAKTALPSTLTELIRYDGNMIEDNGYIIAEGLNDWVANGIPSSYWNQGNMYSLARPSRGGICKLRFRFDNDTLYDPQVGITLNMYKETEEEAIERIDPYEYRNYGSGIPYYWYGINCIAVVWGKREHSGAPGISVRWIANSDWNSTLSGAVLGTHSLSLSATTDYWLMTRFEEGKLYIYYRADSSNSWTSVGTYTLTDVLGDLVPWYRADQKGRFGLYLYNETPWQNSYAMTSDNIYLPFISKTDQHGRTFPIPDVYIVDHEQFNITSMTGSATNNLLGNTIDGLLHPGVSQPWDNTYQGPYTGYPIWSTLGSPVADHNHYDGMVLQFQDSGRQFVVQDVDYDAPQQWVDTSGLANWTDYIGNVSYGNWGDGYWRAFVSVEPRTIKSNQNFGILYRGNGTRGYGGSTKTSHNFSRMNLYTSSRIKVDRFHAFTNEREWSMADMMTEIARKAGVIDILPKNHIDESSTLVRSSSSWALGSQLSSYGIRLSNVVARARKTSGSGEYGIQFGRVDGSGGYVLTHDVANSKVVLRYADSKTIIEQIPVDSFSQWVTFSVQKNVGRVYFNEQLVAAFSLPADIDTQAYAAPAYKSISVNYDWQELSMRVDNFIMDIGKRGHSILQQLIGQKRLWWQDDQYGRLRLYRERVTINSGDPWDMVYEGGRVFNEADLATRVRVEGAEAWQAIDEDAIQLHGSIFRVANAEDVENAQDAAVEAEWLIDEMAKTADGFTLSGAADARLEAGDKIEVRAPSESGLETKTIICDQVNMSMKVTEREAIFDMTVQGHNASVE